MTATKLQYAIAAALLASLALAGCKKGAEDTTAVTPPAATEPSALPPAEPLPPADTTPIGGTETALNVSSVTLGTEAGDDKKVAAAMTTFAPTDPIIVSIATDGAASNAEIAAKLVYQDGQTAGEQSEMVTTTGMETTNITFTNANPWPTGDYTAEVWINGTQTETTAFNVR
ncbi:MAG: hypothetical protein ACREPV_00505 [Lysobacter sp.]